MKEQDLSIGYPPCEKAAGRLPAEIRRQTAGSHAGFLPFFWQHSADFRHKSTVINKS